MDGGDPAVADLVAGAGAEEAWRLVQDGALGEPVAQRAARVSVEAVQRLAAAAGIRFVIPGDEEWPEGLADLGHADPIQRRGGMPVGLWLRGPGQLAQLMRRVGGHRGLAGGHGVRERDGHGSVGRPGGTGRDGGVRRCVRDRRGRASRRLGGRRGDRRRTGLRGRRRVPAGQRASCSTQLARDHLLVSELPPGAHPTRVRFLARNRLIAAMSSATVVVEAALRSGARNTAGWALECGRPLMAVPGSVYSRASTAPHLMIRSGQAVLVTNAAEVMELMSPTGQDTLPLVHGPQRATDALSESQLAVYEAVPARRRAAVGDIALAAGVSVPGCLGALASLEAAGLVEGDARGWLATFGRPR